MRLTTKGRFAVTAMVDLAMRQTRGPVTLAAISERQHISLSYLEQLFGKLRRREAGVQRARAGRRLPPRAADAERHRGRHHHRGGRAARRHAVRRQGELRRRQALHDARPVGDAEREDARVPVLGERSRTWSRSRRASRSR